MARSGGFEPPTAWFVARYSIQLSYERPSPSTEADYRDFIGLSQMRFLRIRFVAVARDATIIAGRPNRLPWCAPMLPLLALISSGASLVDGLGSVNAIDRLGLMDDSITSDLAGPTVEFRFLLLKEDDSIDLISSRALNDFHIEHNTGVNQLTPQDASSSTALADATKKCCGAANSGRRPGISSLV